MNKSEDCLKNDEENDEEYDEVFICHKIRLMCSNWYYANYPKEAIKLNLQTYRKKQYENFSMLRSFHILT